jgi:2-iminobutanoate/2-iminopropanoate deaminase
VWAGDFLFLSGVCGSDLKTCDDIKSETKKAMETAALMLASEGLDFGNVVNTRIYLTDLDKFTEMNEVYKSFFSQPYPARATVEVSKLVDGANIEIVFVAYKGK